MTLPKVNWTRVAWAAGLLAALEIGGAIIAHLAAPWLAILAIGALGAAAYVVWEETASRAA